MTKRAALYARFSTSLQNPRSIEDQMAVCRRHAERIGATVVSEHHDAAISGAAMANRPGLAALMAQALAGAVDVVITEELSRLTRDGGHPWDLFYDLAAAGVVINTIAEGAVDELAIGLKGTMNALERKANGARVRRGLTGVIASGRLASRPPYGYRRRREYDSQGEPIRGLVEIDPGPATVVLRIHREFAAGSSGQAIAMRLNGEGVPGPSGGQWHSNAILGDARRLQGVLRNPIYSGEIVWNRATHPKDRRTGRAGTRLNAPVDYVRQPVAALCIVDPATWSRVQTRLAELSAQVAARGNPSAANAPRRLFSGLLKCGLCGSALATAGPDRRYRCRARTDRGPTACANARTAPAAALESEVMAILRRDLLHPDVVESVVRRYHDIQAAKGSTQRARLTTLQRELAEVERKAERLVDQVADGLVQGRAVQAKLAELEARRTTLEAELASLRRTADVVALHPRAAARYRELVEDLQAKLAADAAGKGSASRDAARAVLRKVIREIRFLPGARRGEWSLAVDGDLTALFLKANAATGRIRATGT